jgi:hypothetical protein
MALKGRRIDRRKAFEGYKKRTSLMKYKPIELFIVTAATHAKTLNAFPL